MIDAVLDAYGKFGVGRQRLNVSRNAARPEANPEEICDPVLEINSTRTCLDSWRAVPLMQRMGGDSNINLASIIAAVGDGRIFRACWADSIPLYRPRTRPCGSPAIWRLPMPAKTFGSLASAQVVSNRTERSNSPATRRRTRPLQNVPDRQAWKTRGNRLRGSISGFGCIFPRHRRTADGGRRLHGAIFRAQDRRRFLGRGLDRPL